LPAQDYGKPEQFLSLLREESANGYVSGQALAKKARISRSAVWKQIRRLRRYGYAIESLHGMGYRLAGETDSPVPWELAKALHASFVKNIVYREALDSTQNLAISIASKPASHGTVVIAEQQKSGRGRMKRKWLSPKGGLWLSVVLQPSIPTAQITLLPFVAALAVCEAIREGTKLDAGLKWPNDVMISGKKVAGILLDISAETEQVNYAVIGIGLNANVDSSLIASRLEPGTMVTSIKDELGREASRLVLARLLLEKLEHYYLELERHGPPGILQKWKQRSDMLGRQVSVTQGGRIIRGVAAGLNDDGSLLLKADDKEINIVSGDIQVRY
jgi:BirA family transcriptional regulator, biotin operon repressor / biotin---[acetyl-CoA-carboxylase] ligase